MKNVAFYAGLATLCTHELDAVANHEWRLLPGLRLLPDETGMIIFVVAHIPLFALLFGLISSPRSATRSRTRVAIGTFLVVHVGLHLLFHGHSAYEFSSVLSTSLIYGGGLIGMIHLMLERREKSSGAKSC